MDEQMTAKEILETYDEITIGQQVFDDVLFFTLFEKQFLFWAPSIEDPASQASIYLYNDQFLDFPHVMLRAANITDGKIIPNGTYRWVCLFEHNSIVNSLVSYEDKIFDTIDRLIELLSMNQVDREREFQKIGWYIEDGTLFITGSGEMTDYMHFADYGSTAPWNAPSSIVSILSGIETSVKP